MTASSLHAATAAGNNTAGALDAPEPVLPPQVPELGLPAPFLKLP